MLLLFHLIWGSDGLHQAINIQSCWSGMSLNVEKQARVTTVNWAQVQGIIHLSRENSEINSLQWERRRKPLALQTFSDTGGSSYYTKCLSRILFMGNDKILIASTVS